MAITNTAGDKPLGFVEKLLGILATFFNQPRKPPNVSAPSSILK